MSHLRRHASEMVRPAAVRMPVIGERVPLERFEAATPPGWREQKGAISFQIDGEKTTPFHAITDGERHPFDL